MPDILTMISKADRLSFSQNFNIGRPEYLGDKLFPDVKTENLTAEYFRLAQGATIPVMATVHSFDSEAQIGSRDALDKASVEKLLIKRKINQSERLQQVINRGVNADDELVRYIFDDMRLMAEGVKVRTEAAKMEVLSTGKMKINENGLKLEVDYGVPTTNTNRTITASADDDIFEQIQKIVDDASDAGYVISAITTSTKVVRKLCANKAVQKRLYGVNGEGMFVTIKQVEELLANAFGITELEINDSKYRYEDAKGKKNVKRFFPDDVMSFRAEANYGTFGVGLWGVTPEEASYGQYSAKSANQFITLTQWVTPDPTVVWTKATGLFVPVLPDPNALFVAKVS